MCTNSDGILYWLSTDYRQECPPSDSLLARSFPLGSYDCWPADDLACCSRKLLTPSSPSYLPLLSTRFSTKPSKYYCSSASFFY